MRKRTMRHLLAAAATLTALWMTSCVVQPANDDDDDDGGSSANTSATAGSGGAGGQGGGDAAGGSTGTGQIGVPDPGTGPAPDRWFVDGGFHGTPETAQPMGVVTTTPQYVQGGLDPTTGMNYKVFRTGPEYTFFSINLNNKTSNIAYVHLHEAEGLVFGAEVPKTADNGPTSAGWAVKPDSVYVLEVHSPGGGFF